MRKPVWFTLAALAAALLACSAAPAAWFGGPGGRIIYQSNQTGNTELYLLDLTTNQTTRLTKNSAEDFYPAEIAARGTLGFVSDLNSSGLNFYEMDLANLAPQAVFTENLIADYPDWSPDGNQIAASACVDYQEYDPECLYDLVLLKPGTSNLTRLTQTPNASEWVPDWSPDGQKVAFSSDLDGDSEVYVINRDGTGLQQLTDNSGYDGRPRWSPDGQQIAFETDQGGEWDWDIFLMNADGSNPQPLTSDATTSDWMEAWSPDGEWLVYVASQEENQTELYLMRRDGSAQRRLTNNALFESAPVWIP